MVPESRVRQVGWGASCVLDSWCAAVGLRESSCQAARAIPGQFPPNTGWLWLLLSMTPLFSSHLQPINHPQLWTGLKPPARAPQSSPGPPPRCALDSWSDPPKGKTNHCHSHVFKPFSGPVNSRVTPVAWGIAEIQWECPSVYGHGLL